MNYDQIGKKIRCIRENELKQSREEFAEEIGISIHTANRLENATAKVSNVEIYWRISQLTGYTIEELLSENNSSKNKEKIRRKIDYILNVASDDELEYLYVNINQFLKFIHKDEIRTLKDIKEENKKKKKEII